MTRPRRLLGPLIAVAALLAGLPALAGPVYTQSYESVTPPATPTGWNYDSGWATAAGSVLNGTNTLTISSTGLKSAFYATQDGKAGQVSVGSRVRVDSPGTSSTIKFVSRLSDATLASFGASANAYVAEVTLGTSNTADFKLVRQNSATATTLATGNTALRTALSAATPYDVALYANGNAATPGVVVSIEVQRTSDGLWLNSSGSWVSDRANCLAFTDTTATNVLAQGYSGIQSNLAAGATAYFDDYLVNDYFDPTTFTKVWTDNSGFTSGLGTITTAQFNSGTEPGIQFAGDNVQRAMSTLAWHDRQYANLPTGSVRFKFSAWSSSMSTWFRTRQYRFFLDGTNSSVKLIAPDGSTVAASFALTYANFTAAREYRLIWSSSATTIKYALQDTVTGNFLTTSGTFASGFGWCFNYTYPTSPGQPGYPFTVLSQNNGPVLTVGKVTIGPAGSASVTPNPATVSTGGSQAFTPVYFTGVDTVATVPTGGGTFSGNTYTAPGSAGTATARFTDAYDTSQTVDVPVTINSVAATSYTLSGPTSGIAGAASTNFTVTPNGTSSGTVTPSDSSGGGTFTPSSLTWAGDASAKTFTYTPATGGVKSISITSSPVLTYSGSPISYTSTALLSTAYVASNGSDSTTNGGSSSTPFLTVAAARSAMVTSGGTLNLRGGDTFSGKITITAPMTIQSYGTGRATVTAVGSVIQVVDAGSTTVNNLIVTNTATGQGTVYFQNTDATRRLTSAVTNCVITGGSRCIYFSGATATAGGFNGITITGNDCSGSTAVGIELSDSANAGTNRHFSNVLIQGNTVYSITGAGGFAASGVVLGSGDTTTGTGAGPLSIRANHIYNLGASATGVAGPAGIFPVNTDGCVVEDNLIHDILCSSQNTDGDALDFDSGASNCISQRNYAYNCQGPGQVFFESGAGNTCRFNVFANTGTANVAKNSGIRFQFTNAGVVQYVHNNIVYNTGTGTNQAGLTSNSSNSINGKKVYNNVFITATGVPAIDVDGFDSTFALEGNAYQSGTGVSFRVGGTTVTSLATFRSNYGRETGHGFVTTAPFIGYGSAIPAPTDPTTMLTTIGTYFNHPSGSSLSLAGLNLQSLYSINPGTLDFKGSTIPTPPYSVGAIATAAAPPTATSFTLTGPSSGNLGVASTSFTVTPNASYTGTITVTPSGGGLSSPVVLTFSGSATPQTFAITPTASGTVTLTPSNNGSLANPSAPTYLVTASAYTLTGPSSGKLGVASTSFTVTPNAAYTGTITVTPSGGGLSTPVVLTFSGSATPQTFTVTPTASGTVTLTPTNNGGLTDPSAPTYLVTASAYTLTGPGTGVVGVASTNFTATPNAPYSGTITVTPSGGGLSTPVVLTFSASATPQTFTVTPASAGTITLTPTNNGSLTNPSALGYTATSPTGVATSYTVPGFPTAPVAGIVYPVVVALDAPAGASGVVTFAAATGITWGGPISIASGATSGATTVTYAAAGSYTPAVGHTGLGFSGEPTLPAVTASAATSSGVGFSSTDAANLASVKQATDLIKSMQIAGTVAGSAAPAAFAGNSQLSASDNFYRGSVLTFTSGQLKGISRRIDSYVGATRTFTFRAASPWPVAPSVADAFVIQGRID